MEMRLSPVNDARQPPAEADKEGGWEADEEEEEGRGWSRDGDG